MYVHMKNRQTENSCFSLHFSLEYPITMGLPWICELIFTAGCPSCCKQEVTNCKFSIYLV